MENRKHADKRKTRGRCPKKENSRYMIAARVVVWVITMLISLLPDCRMRAYAEISETTESVGIAETAGRTESARQRAFPVYEREIEQEVLYPAIEAAEKIPMQIEVLVQDGDQEAAALCDLERTEEQESFWQDGFLLPITVHVWGADRYQLGTNEIKAGEDAGVLLNYEEELLAEAGLSAENYRILEIHWDGDVYVDASGETCRNATATGQKLVTSVKAYYMGKAQFAELPDYLREQSAAETEDLVEETLEETMTASETEETVEKAQVTVLEETETAVQEEEYQTQTLWQKIEEMLLWAISLGLILLVIGLLLLAGIRIEKKLRLWYYHRKK